MSTPLIAQYALLREILEKQFRYLSTCIQPSGAIVDPLLGSSLDFQYHYSSLVLSSILLDKVEGLSSTLDYHARLTSQVKNPSSEFNNFFYLLSVLNDQHGRLGSRRSAILDGILHRSDEELRPLNNNFRVLRLLNSILEQKLTGARSIGDGPAERAWLRSIALADGFFVDSSPDVTHLAYHSKIMMCVGLCYEYSKEPEFLVLFNRGVQSLLAIVDPPNFHFYGRSTNTLFALASLYVSLCLDEKFNSKSHFRLKGEISHILRLHQVNSGQISLNLTSIPGRMGYDGYMYDVVYNAYANALFLLAMNIQGEPRTQGEPVTVEVPIGRPGLQVFMESGFVVSQEKDVRFCVNYKGHQNAPKHTFDSRLSAFSILYLRQMGENKMPAVAYPPQPVSRLVGKPFFGLRLKSWIYKKRYRSYLPILSGHTFSYSVRGKTYYPWRVELGERKGHNLSLRVLSKTLSLQHERSCRVELGFENGYSQFLDILGAADDITYGVRGRLVALDPSSEAITVDGIRYQFSSKFSSLKRIPLHTSSGLAYLFICVFRGVNQIKVRSLMHVQVGS